MVDRMYHIKQEYLHYLLILSFFAKYNLPITNEGPSLPVLAIKDIALSGKKPSRLFLLYSLSNLVFR